MKLLGFTILRGDAVPLSCLEAAEAQIAELEAVVTMKRVHLRLRDFEPTETKLFRICSFDRIVTDVWSFRNVSDVAVTLEVGRIP